MKKPFSAGINRRIRHYRRWKGTRRKRGGGPELSWLSGTQRSRWWLLFGLGRAISDACFRFTMARRFQHGCCRLVGTTFCSIFFFFLRKGEWRSLDPQTQFIHSCVSSCWSRAVPTCRSELCPAGGSAGTKTSPCPPPNPFSGVISSHGTRRRRRLSCCLWMSIAFLSNISKVVRV